MNYPAFLERKTHQGCDLGFDPLSLPDWLFDFQRVLVEWAVRKGRAAIFADCGLGKTPMQLVWADNIHRHTGRQVLILTPLSVAAQTEREAHKFGIDAHHSRDGSGSAPILISNYERLHYFKREQFAGVVCDESSILKNFDGVTKAAVTEFMRKTPYRLLCTATAAPNDYIELGTSSEALGNMGFMDMLNRFFKKAETTSSRSEEFRAGIYRFRGYAERDFWRWVCSWARALRKPADVGCANDDFKLPPLTTVEHVIKAITPREDWLFDLPAITLEEQRAERRRTIQERCEMAANLINGHKAPAVAWCHLNDEGDLLEHLIPGAVQISGNDSDDRKEEVFDAFAQGSIRVLVSKPVIAGFGLNWQHCAHQTFFPSHSFEQWYQAIRRSWRFGQTQPVRVDVIASEGEAGVLMNLTRKSEAADAMFANLVSLMNNELKIEKRAAPARQLESPSWL